MVRLCAQFAACLLCWRAVREAGSHAQSSENRTTSPPCIAHFALNVFCNTKKTEPACALTRGYTRQRPSMPPAKAYFMRPRAPVCVFIAGTERGAINTKPQHTNRCTFVLHFYRFPSTSRPRVSCGTTTGEETVQRALHTLLISTWVDCQQHEQTPDGSVRSFSLYPSLSLSLSQRKVGLDERLLAYSAYPQTHTLVAIFAREESASLLPR